MLSMVKGPMDAEKSQEDTKNTAALYKELMIDACRHVRADITQHAFYAKYEPAEAKANLIMMHS